MRRFNLSMNSTYSNPRSQLHSTGTPRHRPSYTLAQCTHITVTRLYTKEFRCSVCGREPSTGWLWRCTQDRELLLEEDRDIGFVEKGNDIFEGFPRPSSPRKRSPAARLSRLSFLQELTDDDLMLYTPTQIGIILDQRAHLLEVAARAAAPDTMIKQPEPQLTPKAADKSSSAASSPVSKNTQSQSPSRRSAKVLKKPWIPLKNGECQFKCCQNCRPSLNERSYLSINGIVNNDFPLTAITGFGFHLQKARPVADVKHVRNLGLRPNPEPVPKEEESDSQTSKSGDDEEPSGLCLINSTPADPFFRPTSPTPENQAPDEVADHVPAIVSSIDPSILSNILNVLHPTSPQTQNGSIHETPSGLSVGSFENACRTPLPEQTSSEVTSTNTVLKWTEASESTDGEFGSAPLIVEEGVAVTEEAVEFGVPDLITHL